MQQFAHRLIIGNGLDGVAQQRDLVALLGDQAAHQQIVGRAILQHSVAAETVEARARGGDGRAQRELDSVQLPGHQNAGVKIGHHADVLKLVGEGGELSRARRNTSPHPPSDRATEP